MDMDNYITEAFNARWSGIFGDDDSLDSMKKQLHKNLTDQINGYWSGHTAYGIMRDYGFIIDTDHENRKAKKLTKLGELFMKSME